MMTVTGVDMLGTALQLLCTSLRLAAELLCSTVLPYSEEHQYITRFRRPW